MKLQLRTIPYSGLGRAYVLCDEFGEQLPGQRAVKLEQRVQEMSVVTVEFMIDGRDITVAESK